MQQKKPKILRVVTNVSNATFKIGDKIMVGLEGTAGGKAYFDVDPLIKKGPNVRGTKWNL